MKTLFEKVAVLVKQRIRESVWTRIGLVLSVVVVFCTTYALVLPALTLSSSSSSSVVQQEKETSVTETVESTQSTQDAATTFSTAQEVETQQSSTIQESAPQPTGNQAGQFEVEADNVIVKVSYEAETFTEAVSLKVSAIDDSSGYEQKLSSLLEEKNQILTQTYSYDIAFVNATGVEVEPSKVVDVSIQFKDAVTSTNLQDGWKLYHFVNNDVNEVEDLTDDKATDIKQDNLENVTSVEFKSDSFSPYVIAGTSYEDFKPYIVSGSFQGTTTETLHSDGSRTLQTDLKLDYDIPKTELNKSKSYAIELPQDTTWTSINENQEYTGKDGGRDAYKYRFVQENGKKYIVISFLDSYLATAGDKVHGDLIYTATIGQTYRKETSNYEIPFTDKVTITVPSDKIEKKEEPQQAQYDLSSKKEGSVTYDGDNAYLNYTVEVSSNKGTKDVVNLTDTLKVDGFKIESFEKLSVIRTDSNGTTADLTNSTNLNYSNGKFTTQLPKLSANQKYKITYRYKISGFPAGKSTNIGNGLDLTTPDIPNQHQDKHLEVYRNKIGKTGQYDPSTNKIKWTITVNENKNDIAGAELKDTMIAQASDVQITPSNGATKTATGYTFSATDGGKNTNKYVITYTTDAGEKPDSWNAQAKNVTNTATFTDGGESSSTSATTPGGIGDTGGLTKKFDKIEATGDSKLKMLTWTSTIKVPGDGIIPKGTEFTDTLSGNHNNAWTEHYYTNKQIDAIYSLLVDRFGAGNFDFSVWESGQGTWQWSNYDSSNSQKTYRQFKFRLLKDYRSSKDIDLTYTSTANVESIINFDNTIGTTGFSQKAEYRYDANSKVTKMDGSQSTSDGKEYETKDTSHTINADGTITWVVKVALEDNSTSLTLTDTPPVGLTLVGVKYGVRNGNQTDLKYEGDKLSYALNKYYNAFKIIVDGTVNTDGSVVLNFSAAEGTTLKAETKANQSTYGDNLYVWFTFKSTDGALDENVTKSYTNKVSATLDGSPAGEDDHTQKITITPSQKVSKGGSWSNDNREVNYKLDINPYDEDLAAGKASYTVTDTLEYREDLLTNLSYDLKQESVKLYDSNNQELDKSLWSWTVEKTKDSSGVYKSVLKLTVPNKQKLRLEYSYTVSREVAADDITNLSVKNTAEVSGFKTGKKENTVSYTWQKMSTSGTAQTTKYFKLTKVDLNNFAIVLPNAIFEVRENITDKVVATYKTGTDGTLYVTKDGKEAISKIEDLKNDTLYYIIEVTSPDGYKLPDTSNQKRYYFYFSDTNSLPSNIGGLVTSLPEMTNLAKQSKQEFVENEQLPPTTSVTVNKKWQNADGSDAQRTSGKIIVSLKRISDSDTTPVEIESREVTYDGDQWQTTFNNLPTKGDNGEYYTYFVEEQAVVGYKATYSNASKTSEKPSDVAVSSGTITITNKAQKAYNLPKTGGIGLEPVYLWGIILVALGILLLSLKLYRTYQGGGFL
ncbi:MAG: Cna B-type domain-containing protein [Streptococcus orisratti]|uniref:Cna B-type domain-containing protein n=1 Tax=Streptococcus orisratti TaxID=114652 RepID=UPI0023542B9D|nr:Cna B-type domain-containing protein [Streptococcus orisratti]MCI7678382.1 Cna B-type domain-containing protein [Streptococcus orisratti]